jgi:urease accessory protein
MPSWLVLQLADSAFPTGSFAHSAGLEAHVQAGELASLETFCTELVDQLAQSALPIAAATFDEPERIAELDTFTHATLWSQVASRASRLQGRALLDVAARSFGVARVPVPHGHLAPVYGYVNRLLGVERDEALASFLHLGLRGALSAAVRLGVAGPTEAQALHHRLHPVLEAALVRARTLRLDDVAQPSPLSELIAATHDQLYSRLFQS